MKNITWFVLLIILLVLLIPARNVAVGQGDSTATFCVTTDNATVADQLVEVYLGLSYHGTISNILVNTLPPPDWLGIDPGEWVFTKYVCVEYDSTYRDAYDVWRDVINGLIVKFPDDYGHWPLIP